ncbi:MAG: hypothetical protein AAF400_03210, partial [Bacteroidota bacterium]
MNTRNMKQTNCYSQGQRRLARILFAVWLLTSYSPDSTFAAPEPAKSLVPAATASPSTLPLASTPPTPQPGSILQLPPASPASRWGSSVASSPAIDTAPQRQPAASLHARTIGKLVGHFSGPRTQINLRTQAGPVAEGDEAGPSSLEATSPPATPSTLAELMSQEGVPDNDTLIETLNAAPPDKQYQWIDAAIQWFTSQPIET